MSDVSARIRMNFWRWIFLSLVAGGLVASLFCAARGLGTATNLSDTFPWGICTGLDVFCGISLTAGGLLIASVIYLAEWRRGGRAIVRVALLIACCAYVVSLLGEIASVAYPTRIAPLLLGIWSPRSVLAGGFGSLLLLAIVIALEFSPDLCRHLGRRAPWWAHSVAVPMTLLAAVVVLLQQFALARLIMLSQNRFSPLWSSPRLPVLMLLSAVCASLAVMMFVFARAQRGLGRALLLSRLAPLSRAMTILLFFYVAARLGDLIERGTFNLLLKFRAENYFLGIELSLFLLPLMLLAGGRGAHRDPRILFWSAVLVIAGFLANRLNTAITSLEAIAHASYVPKWPEVLVAYSLIAWGVGMFVFAARRLRLFVAGGEGLDFAVSD